MFGARPTNRIPRSAQNFAMATLRTCMPGATPCRLHFSISLSIVEISSGCSNCPGMPSAIDRSAGPTMITSRPFSDSKFVGPLHRRGRFELHHRQRVAVLMLDDLCESRAS